MKYLIVDAALNGTGIRDQYQGGYISLEDLSLNRSTIERIRKWLSRYENEHYQGYHNHKIINELDEEGKKITRIILNELPDVKVKYFSDARMCFMSLGTVSWELVVDTWMGSTALSFKGAFKFGNESIPFRLASFAGRGGNYSKVDYPPNYHTGYGSTVYYRFDLFHGGGYEGLTITFDELIKREHFNLLEKHFGW